MQDEFDRRKLIIFRHENELGKAPSHLLFEAVSVARKDGVDVPRSFSDYKITIDQCSIPGGVELIERI